MTETATGLQTTDVGTPSASTSVFVYDVAGKLIAEYGGVTSSSNAGTSYLTTDHLGSTRVVTNSSGAVIARHDYLPFGTEIQAGTGGRTPGQGYSVLDDTRQKFTSKERDDESTLDYFLARYYSPAQGTFMTVDPSRMSSRAGDPRSWNRYCITLDNPGAYVDTNGEWPTWAHELIVDRAFPGLSVAERGHIKRASADMDSPDRGGWDPENSYKHGLRAPDQTVKEAQEKSSSFISNRIVGAKNLQGGGSYPSAASLYLFGEAFHTVTDMTSPPHLGFHVGRG